MPKNVRICPKCRSAKVRHLSNVSGWLAPGMYECLECGHNGRFFVLVDLDELKRMKAEKEKLLFEAKDFTSITIPYQEKDLERKIFPGPRLCLLTCYWKTEINGNGNQSNFGKI